MNSMVSDFLGILKGFVTLSVYFVIGFLGIVGIVYMLSHLFSTETTVSTLDNHIRVVFETLRYRL
ncbi:hypothetical protein MKY84_12945 [Chryseomicrobium sp. FSL W7-1435]|uniref:hypothetical protein n=1 Tax=Chryseomicrobium sp. FSL W7-1435 TaxID=2921704 RepID=UPI00315A9A0C